jgi:CTP synthase
MTLVPFIEMSREQKTKPTQRSVKELNDIGIVPDAIVCRSDQPIDKESRRKLSLFCNVPSSAVIPSLMDDEIFEMPLKLEENGLAGIALKKFGLENRKPDLSVWKDFYSKAAASFTAGESVNIAVVGKYADKPAAYTSLSEALFYSAINARKRLLISYIKSDELNPSAVSETLGGFDGIVVPAGFGERGFDGKITACDYARQSGKPCLMIGFGAEAGVISVLSGIGGLKAGTEEFLHAGEHAVIRRVKSPEAGGFKKGDYKSFIIGDTVLSGIYGGAETVTERHRHKFEISPDYRAEIEKCGVKISATGDAGEIEAFELDGHKFFIGVIYRPEFKARPDNEHPLFKAFINALPQNV